MCKGQNTKEGPRDLEQSEQRGVSWDGNGEVGKNATVQDLKSQGKDFGFYLKWNGKPP